MIEWDKIFISATEYENDIKKLIRQLEGNKFKYVYGPPRGGFIIAVYLSHWFHLAFLPDSTFKYNLRNDEVLIVDDITHTGSTLIPWNKLGFKTATLYYREQSVIKPDYFIRIAEPGQWIKFPYEREDEIPNRED